MLQQRVHGGEGGITEGAGKEANGWGIGQTWGGVHIDDQHIGLQEGVLELGHQEQTPGSQVGADAITWSPNCRDGARKSWTELWQAEQRQ